MFVSQRGTLKCPDVVHTASTGGDSSASNVCNTAVLVASVDLYNLVVHVSGTAVSHVYSTSVALHSLVFHVPGGRCVPAGSAAPSVPGITWVSCWVEVECRLTPPGTPVTPILPMAFTPPTLEKSPTPMTETPPLTLPAAAAKSLRFVTEAVVAPMPGATRPTKSLMPPRLPTPDICPRLAAPARAPKALWEAPVYTLVVEVPSEASTDRKPVVNKEMRCIKL